MKNIYILPLLILALIACSERELQSLSSIEISGNQVEDIREITERVVPYVYTSAIDLSSLDVQEKKQAFIHLMVPSILIAKHELEQHRKKVLELGTNPHDLSPSDEAYLSALQKKYKCTSHSELLLRLRTHPTSIVIAQAAIESGWGTSRFYKEANNVFGVWSYHENEPRMRASEAREGASVYVKKYGSLPESIASYFQTIARGPYAGFREKRDETNEVFELTPHLLRYSELREVYVERVQELIKYNQLERYDSYLLEGNK